MSKKYHFRISRFLKRDLVVRVNSLEDGSNVVRSSRRLYEFNPTRKKEDEGWYETTDGVLIDSLRNQTETLPWSRHTEAGLERDNVEFEYTFCASCGNNRVKKIQYHLFEIYELDADGKRVGYDYGIAETETRG